MSTVSAAAAAKPGLRASERARVAVTVGSCLVGMTVLAVIAARHAAPSEVSPVVPRDEWNDIWVGSIVASFVLYGVGAYLAWSGAMRLRVAVIVAVDRAGSSARRAAAPLEGRVSLLGRGTRARRAPREPVRRHTRAVSQRSLDAVGLRVMEIRAEPVRACMGARRRSACRDGSSRLVAELAYRVIALVALLGVPARDRPTDPQRGGRCVPRLEPAARVALRGRRPQ